MNGVDVREGRGDVQLPLLPGARAPRGLGEGAWRAGVKTVNMEIV